MGGLDGGAFGFENSKSMERGLFKVLNIPWRKEAVSDEILVLEVTQKVTPEGCASRAMAVTVSPPLTWSHT